jgi:hypothetical protein
MDKINHKPQMKLTCAFWGTLFATILYVVAFSAHDSLSTQYTLVVIAGFVGCPSAMAMLNDDPKNLLHQPLKSIFGHLALLSFPLFCIC